LNFPSLPSYSDLLVCVKEKFIYGVYDISSKAEENLFTWKNSVIKGVFAVTEYIGAGTVSQGLCI
jgi:hypothetical protein